MEEMFQLKHHRKYPTARNQPCLFMHTHPHSLTTHTHKHTHTLIRWILFEHEHNNHDGWTSHPS